MKVSAEFSRRKKAFLAVLRALANTTLFLSTAIFSPLMVSSREHFEHVLTFPKVPITRAVTGAVVNSCIEYHHSEVVTSIFIIDFATDSWWQSPNAVRLPFCGDHSAALRAVVHKNVTITYNPASPRRRTGCVILLTIAPLQDSSPWQTVSF